MRNHGVCGVIGGGSAEGRAAGRRCLVLARLRPAGGDGADRPLAMAKFRFI
jgi:hypothetical protein